MQKEKREYESKLKIPKYYNPSSIPVIITEPVQRYLNRLKEQRLQYTNYSKRKELL